MDEKDFDICLKVLGTILNNSNLNEEHKKLIRIRKLAGRICASKGDAQDEIKAVVKAQPWWKGRCYSCKNKMDRDTNVSQCQPCLKVEIIEQEKGQEKGAFAGKVALVTGGRINLGYVTALRLLRGGAEKVIVTTRWVEDAQARYESEEDYINWKNKLHLIQSDFTSLQSIYHVVIQTSKLVSHLDILINNAAQTVPVPVAEHHSHSQKRITLENQDPLSLIEKRDVSSLPLFMVAHKKSALNAWEARFDEFPYTEMVDVFSINVFAPFVLARELAPLMSTEKSSTLIGPTRENTYIINVSSREGLFVKPHGSGKHVHTNMAKAALNMMTHTLGRTFSQKKILMITVDPGYLSHQHAVPHTGIASIEEETPLTWEQGATRVLAPILKKLKAGDFYKDFKLRDIG